MSYLKVLLSSKPSTPPSGSMYLYAKGDGKFYTLDASDAESPLGSTNTTMTNDPAWNAKGDLVVGSGNDFAAIHPVGANRKLLIVNPSGALGISWESLNAVDRLNITDAGSNVGLNFEPIPASWKRMVFEDEFMSALGTSGNIGALGWYLGAGTVTNIDSTNVANHPGIINLSSTSTSNTIARMALTSAGGTGLPIGYPTEVESNTYILRPKTAFTTSGSIRLGLVAILNSTGDSAQGMYFSKVTNDANWMTVCRDGSNIVRKSSGVAYTANNWYLFEIKILSASEVRFYINNNLVAVHTTNITNGAVYPTVTIETNNTTIKTIDIDYFGLIGKPYTSRWT
jgi:hypothetical protein